jgi:AraC-like DNA-binding protein
MHFKLSIYQIQFFTEPARSDKLLSKHHFLTLISKGLERGRFAGHDFAQPAPFLAVTFANEPLIYSFNADRQNWIISFLSPDIRPGRLPHLMEIRQDNTWISVPRQAFLPPADVLRFTEEYQALSLAFSQPTPIHLFRIEAGMLGLFRYLMERRTPPSETGIAASMKTRLEDRTTMGKRIAELGTASGYSRDYPSMLFKREFGTSPLAYRNRCRMQLAAEMLAEGKKSVKAIALELGFKHVSHLSGMFRRTFGVSPRMMHRGH